MAGERLIGPTGITTSLASPAVVLKRPKKWAMICLVCITTVSVLRIERKKERKKLLISFQLRRVDVKILILYICDNDLISFRN